MTKADLIYKLIQELLNEHSENKESKDIKDYCISEMNYCSP